MACSDTIKPANVRFEEQHYAMAHVHEDNESSKKKAPATIANFSQYQAIDVYLIQAVQSVDLTNADFKIDQTILLSK